MDIEQTVESYKRFVGITAFPDYDIEYFKPDLDREYTAAAQADYEIKSEKLILRLPSNYDSPQFLLYHELTHILDMEKLKSGDKSYDFCLTGYMEYHASQVELMVLMGAENITDQLSFSMEDTIHQLNETVEQYLLNKLNASVDFMNDADSQKKVDGLGVFYNFLGLWSVCDLFATDLVDSKFSLQGITDLVSTLLLHEIRRTMTGWNVDVERAVVLYSNAVRLLIN